MMKKIYNRTGAEKGLISIVIPTYNRAQSVSTSIQSVLDQSAGNWELIIIDDGSTDTTKAVIKDYLIDKRIRYFYQRNSGVSAARNKGVELSRGDYIIFLDSDDQFYPQLISNLNNAHYQNYDLICWKVLKIINGSKHIWEARQLGGMYNGLKVTFFPGSICYRKDIFITAGGYDPIMSFGENYELGIRVSEIKRLKIFLLDQICLQYNLDTVKRTSNSLTNRLNSHLHQLKKHSDKYNQNKKAKAELNYIIGFVLEKMNKKSAACDYYTAALKNNPFKPKHVLKFLYFKFWVN